VSSKKKKPYANANAHNAKAAWKKGSCIMRGCLGGKADFNYSPDGKTCSETK
jgi:hypothetical protein